MHSQVAMQTLRLGLILATDAVIADTVGADSFLLESST
jgi:hypothetical protein